MLRFVLEAVLAGVDRTGTSRQEGPVGSATERGAAVAMRRASALHGSAESSVSAAAEPQGAPRILLLGWSLYLILSPFYVFSSGNPQPADFLMAALILAVLTGTMIRVALAPDLYMCLSLFLLVVTLVNLFWWSIFYERMTMMAIMFYSYNSSIVVFLVSMIRAAPGQVLAATQLGLLAAILIETAAIVLMPPSTFRGVGTFNNPNQLGYWGLLVAVCWLVTRGDRKLAMLDLGVFLMAGYLVAVSLSKAAMIAFGILSISAVFGQGVRTRSMLAAVGLLALISLWLGMTGSLEVRTREIVSEGPIARMVTRFESFGKHADDSAVGRGYDRLWKYPEYLLFGAGEGVTYRLVKAGDEFNELHSTWATVLFSYGIAGFLLFIAILVIIFRHAPWRHSLYFGPIVLYGLVHQGLRFSMLWVFFGLVFGLAHIGRCAQFRAESTCR